MMRLLSTPLFDAVISGELPADLLPAGLLILCALCLVPIATAAVLLIRALRERQTERRKTGAPDDRSKPQ